MKWILRFLAILVIIPTVHSLTRHGYTFIGYIGIMLACYIANLLLSVSDPIEKKDGAR